MTERIEKVNGDLVLDNNTMIDCDLFVDGDIIGRAKERCNLYVNGKITAENIYTWNIFTKDISAVNIAAANISAKNISSVKISAWNISARNISSGNISARNIIAKDISAEDISARDILASNILASDISYYALCFVYHDIRCESIKGRKMNSKHFALDGKITFLK